MPADQPQDSSAAQGRPAGLLMDSSAIMAELGVTKHMADKIARWCNENGAGVIRPVDGARKLYVERSDVDRWLAASRVKDAA